MEDEELLCRFGTPLEPLEEDEIPSKKPIQIEDQIVTDENGRRRFHGAFTGGFSAGFWNTVGSLEGWQPKEFKSSRAEKAELHKQKPSDFMDDEDIGEFGIAPQRVQTTEDFTPQDNKIGQKRKIQQQKINDGPIPGMPVLQQLLRPAKDMVAIRLLKKMGWKQGQGIGARQTRKEKKTTAKRNAREQYIMKMYGCDIGSISNKSNDYDSESDLSDSEEVTFAPDDFQPYACAIKDNTFGLGYTGLCRDPVLKNQHVNLFGPLEILDKDNKKLSIRGQAFGVGALEEEDEDIYQHDDITKYDFTMGNTSKNMKNSNIKQIKNQESFVIDGFNSSSSDNNKNKKKIFKISMPDSYTPRDWFKRRTRFEPLDDNRAETLKKLEEYKFKGLGRHDLKPNERGHILGETLPNKPTEKYESIDENDVKIVQPKKTYLEKINEKYKKREEINFKKRNEILDMLTSKFDKFTKTEIIKGDGTIEKQTDLLKDETIIIDENVKNENDKIQNEANKITSKLDKTAGVFKPFLLDDLKQERYEKFLAANLQTDNEIKKFLLTIQPIHMSEWDREIEKKEFLQSQKIYKPLKGMMKDRFVPESIIIAEREIKQVAKECNEKLTTLRTKKMWKPCSELCKRFNIAEPFGGTMIEEKIIKKTKYSVFDYLETSINDKNTFITPVIIPTKKPEIAKSKIQQQQSQKRISSKDLFTNELKINKNSEDSISNKDKKYTSKKDDIINSQSKYDNTRRKQSTIIEKSKIDKPKTDLERKIEETKDYHPSEKKDLFKSIFDSDSEDEIDEEKVEKNNDKNDTSKSIEIPNDILSILTKPTSELNKLRNSVPSKISVDINKKDFLKPDENLCTSVATVISVATKSITEEFVKPLQKIIFKSKKQRLADEIAQSSKETVESKESPQSKETVVCKDSAESVVSEKFKDCVELTDYNINQDDRLESKDIDNENIYGPKIPISSLKMIQSEVVKEENVKSKLDIDVDEKLSKILKKHKRTKIIEEWIEKTDEQPTTLEMSNDNSRKKKKKDKERDKNKKSKKHKKDKKHKKK